MMLDFFCFNSIVDHTLVSTFPLDIFREHLLSDIGVFNARTEIL